MKFKSMKYLTTFLSSFIIVSLLCVGFSTWMYNSQSYFNIMPSVGDVYYLSDYISSPEIKSFYVCPTGIVVDETIVYKCEISIKTKISLKNGLLMKREDISNTLSIKVNVINDGTFDFFDIKYMDSNKAVLHYSFFYDDSPLYDEADIAFSDNVASSIISYYDNALTSKEFINLEILYFFDFTNYKDNFREQIYDLLGENPLSFHIQFEVL